jgi:hypothetical protein
VHRNSALRVNNSFFSVNVRNKKNHLKINEKLIKFQLPLQPFPHHLITGRRRQKSDTIVWQQRQLKPRGVV